MPIGGTSPDTPGTPRDVNLTRKGKTSLILIIFGMSTVSNVTDAISLSHPQELLGYPAQLSKL